MQITQPSRRISRIMFIWWVQIFVLVWCSPPSSRPGFLQAESNLMTCIDSTPLGAGMSSSQSKRPLSQEGIAVFLPAVCFSGNPVYPFTFLLNQDLGFCFVARCLVRRVDSKSLIPYSPVLAKGYDEYPRGRRKPPHTTSSHRRGKASTETLPSWRMSPEYYA